MPQVGDIVEIARLPAGLRWVVIGLHPQDARRWRVRREFAGGRLQSRNVGVGDLEVVAHPTFAPGQIVRYFGKEAKVLADHGDTVAIRYLYSPAAQSRPPQRHHAGAHAWTPARSTSPGASSSSRNVEKELRPMDDKEFNALRIRASLCPGAETYWPPAETDALGLPSTPARIELRGQRSKTLVAIEAVNVDKSLSLEGKRAAKEKIATQALDELETGDEPSEGAGSGGGSDEEMVATRLRPTSSRRRSC